MTEKIYYADSHIYEFDAVAVACELRGDHFEIRLDRSAFFPEGGGQYGDSGHLSVESGADIEIFDTHEKSGEILHYAKTPVTVGAAVHGCVDWGTRFSRMQQHSGEHIVSGLVHARFGYDNVGFHLGAWEVTLDFNGPITKEELSEIENAANRAVWNNLPVQTAFPDKEALSTLDYRSKIEINGDVRIVTIPGIDVCACCAPHVNNTGEIGLIRLTNVETHRGGVRVSMLAGDRALADCRAKEASVKALSVMLSAKEHEVVEAVERVKQENYRLNGRLNELSLNRVREKASALPADTRDAVFFEEDLNTDAARELVNLLMERCSGVACVFVRDGGENVWRYILGSAAEDVRPLCRSLNAAFNGKGGGKPQMAQGSLCGSPEAVRCLISER